MAVRDILQIGHPVLAEPAQSLDITQIGGAEVQGWIGDMIDTLRAAKGAGIAANQIGIPYRLFVIEIADNPRYPYMPEVPLTVVINPEVEFLSDNTFSSNEGCLSVPNMRADVERHTEIKVTYHDREGQRHSHEVRGYSACVWQHEYDHLDGILFPNRVKDRHSFCSWEMFQAYRQADYARKVEELVRVWGS